MENKLQVGDVVRVNSYLDSQPPKMTVNEITNTSSIECIWFDAHRELHREKFDERLLSKV